MYGREAHPVAYIPLGTLEWHGLYGPLGADWLQAEELAAHCARKGGGLVSPVYYGETRAGSLLETDLMESTVAFGNETYDAATKQQLPCPCRVPA